MKQLFLSREGAESQRHADLMMRVAVATVCTMVVSLALLLNGGNSTGALRCLVTGVIAGFVWRTFSRFAEAHVKIPRSK
ncbi:MAG TPA: hypothetical protein PLD54_02530 [Candidatus Levybacteria bacterium]|nr:hypothetical protein [Candidatus Levybacteria bacterium]